MAECKPNLHGVPHEKRSGVGGQSGYVGEARKCTPPNNDQPTTNATVQSRTLSPHFQCVVALSC
jgi:hypothetical protein